MKKIVLTTIVLFAGLALRAQISENINFLSNWDDDSLPTHFFGTFSDIWGYAADGREYAIMGSAKYTHFFDVTDPLNPVEVKRDEGAFQGVHRDYKVYGNRAYSCSDFDTEGLTIYDLSALPNDVSITYQSNEFFNRAHNIFIDTDNGRLYIAGSDTRDQGLIVLDLTQDPDNPTLLGSVDLIDGQIGEYVHDVYVRDNIAYCSHGQTNSLIIWDFNDAANPQYIASFVSNGYNHSNWVTDDGNTLVFAEEVPTGLPMGILDISDMENDNLELYEYFKFPLLAPGHEDATPHNPFILGDLVYTSYYEDGLMVFDISDPNAPFVAGYYDTYATNSDYNGYAGAWGVYPYLPSGNIIVSDMTFGLYVLEPDFTPVSTNALPQSIQQFTIYPNPANGNTGLFLNSSETVNVQLSVQEVTGRVIWEKELEINGATEENLDLSAFPAGIYFVQLTDGTARISKKVVKH